MKLIISITFVVIVILGGIFVFSSQNDNATQKVDVAGSEKEVQFDKAPEFVLSDFDGNTVSLSDSSGKVRVINSWATWCPFCVNELPEFVQLQEEFGDQVEVITIDRAESIEKAKGFMDELGITGRITTLLDPKDSFYSSIGGFSMPETLFVDGEGNIRVHKRGPMKFEEMKQRVESIINN